MCTEVGYALNALLHTVQGLAYVCGSCSAYHMRAVIDAAATAHNISNPTEQEETVAGYIKGTGKKPKKLKSLTPKANKGQRVKLVMFPAEVALANWQVGVNATQARL